MSLSISALSLPDSLSLSLVSSHFDDAAACGVKLQSGGGVKIIGKDINFISLSDLVVCWEDGEEFSTLFFLSSAIQ